MASVARAGDLYLNIIWHQHQPLYVNPETDELSGPWVRTHATKDYYDMAAMLEKYPEVHAMVNLTSSLLTQLQSYYVERLTPFLIQNAEDGMWGIDADAYFASGVKTDPWIDLALKSTEKFTDADRAKLVSEPWNAFGISDIQIAHFPEYEMMRGMDPERLTTADLRDIKTWFFVAHFDPDFLRGTSALDVNLTDMIEERDGQFFVRDGKRFTERDANRMVAEAVRVMQEVIPEHAKLLASGQLEIITTPFYHPILPLLIDTDIAKVCMPKSDLPKRFAYPQDAHAQVIKGVSYYESLFHRAPQGMWPAEGSISQAAAEVFRNHNVKWICGDMHVLQKSKPEGLDIAQPYRVSTPDGEIAVVFRETTLSDHIGFTYQNMDPDSSVNHFIGEILKFAPTDEHDRLLTVILDGENAWEWYRYDLDAKKFLNGLYTKLTELREQGRVTCVNPTEYFKGSNERNIPAHPIAELTEITDLWPGSWINANYDTWIGEKEENDAWDYLLKARQELEKSGLEQPDPSAPMEKGAQSAATYRAYESMYAAEGSDWFWWYGADQGAPGGDRPFEEAFFSHLRAVYKHMREAGVEITTPEFAPILSQAKISTQETGGVMQRGGEMRRVRFECDASAVDVPESIFIVGNQSSIGDWQPNAIRMRDDGAAGDQKAQDGIWSYEVELPLGTEVQYKYTNSGAVGVWQPSEEFSQSNRAFTVEGERDEVIVRHDVFGVRD